MKPHSLPMLGLCAVSLALLAACGPTPTGDAPAAEEAAPAAQAPPRARSSFTRRSISSTPNRFWRRLRSSPGSTC
ncbi:MAG TPA: hypothetical protein PLS90_08795 [Candidatus Sumerlaeota bacterium]|nr:hypothetical protein [Candidatus Sumerlaeota bacterium]